MGRHSLHSLPPIAPGTKPAMNKYQGLAASQDFVMYEVVAYSRNAHVWIII